MSEEKDRKNAPDSAELTDEEAEKVAGGLLPAVNDLQPPPTGDSQIVSPRDAASGLPTGKRMHKPF